MGSRTWVSRAWLLSGALLACSDTGNDAMPLSAGTASTAGNLAPSAGSNAGQAGSPSPTAGTQAGTPAAGVQAGSAGQGTQAGSPSPTAGAAAAGIQAGSAAAGSPAGTGAGVGAGMEALAGSGGGTDALPPLSDDVALPIIFVHGYAGSAAQYMSQKMRFVANGYPPERILAYDHDGAGFGTSSFIGPLDQLVDGALERFGTSQVYLVGHSRGTFVSASYVGDRTRAAKVAKYIAIDGSSCPSGVECIAPNQGMFPGQKHVEVCTSAESFAMQYEFLIGEAPAVVEIERQASPVEISGRAVNFPANVGRAGATLRVFELDSATGARSKAEPEATFEITAEGEFGPLTVNPDRHYEFELVGGGHATHYYPQPFLRSTDFLRLLSGPNDSPSRMNTHTGDGHSALLAMRNREWLASDVLEVSTTSTLGDQPAVNAMTSSGGAANSIGYYMHDAASSPGDSSLSPLPYFSSQAFQYGVDLYVPASDPASGVVTVRNLPRGDMARPQELNTPNWPSNGHLIVLMFSDFAQD